MSRVTRVGLLVAVTTLVGACFPSLTVPVGANILCGGDDDCASGLLCIDSVCRDATDPCLLPGGDGFVADGTACEAGICVAGACGVSHCGDGYIDARAGEACEPRNDPQCGEDCLASLCGDRALDASETCDPPGIDCNACVQQCDENGTAECDLDASTVCDCASAQIFTLAADELIVSDAAVGRDGYYVVVENLEIARLYYVPDDPNDGGPVLLDDAEFFISLTRNVDGTVYTMLNKTVTTELFVLDGATMDGLGLISTRSLASIAVHQGKIYADEGDVVVVFDATTGLEIDEIAPECGDPQRFTLCGDELVCVPFDDAGAKLTVVPLDGSAARVFDDVTNPSFGCVTAPDGVERIVWTDGINLFMEIGEGGRTALRALPPSSADSNDLLALTPMLTFEDGILLGDLSLRGFVTWRYDFNTRAMLGIVNGLPVDATPERILVEDGTGVHVVRR